MGIAYLAVSLSLVSLLQSLCSSLPAERPLGIVSNGRAFLPDGWLLIDEAPGWNHAVLEVGVLQRHRLRVIGVDSRGTRRAIHRARFRL